MTQEELDALMAGDLDQEIEQLDEQEAEEESSGSSEESNIHKFSEEELLEQGVDLNSDWPPPPPTQKHKVVDQLDHVTKDSEEKATEIFDKLEDISGGIESIEEISQQNLVCFQNNVALFEKLCVKFPNVESFETALAENKEALKRIELNIERSQSLSDDAMMIMEIMQYQDIHRQKIERVINVMRALSKYMQSLFDSDREDSKRVQTANHIEGDQGEVVSADEIEALLESFSKK
ncbi:MAG: DUF2890 domain-containing protein [Epsilonproteobacteria bacterium]|nr:DUF2890 domain-containing protein [Campylobacterota bacterium]